MYNENERTWFNQEILTCYGKKVDEVSSTLSLTIGLSTKNFLQYSPPGLLIRISDPSKHVTVNLDRCSCRKVVNFLDYVFNEKEGSKQTRIYSDKIIKVAFRQSSGGKEAIIGLVNGIKECVFVCEISDLEEIKETIKSFLSICTQLACQNLFIRKEVTQQSGLLRTLPSQIFPIDTSDSFDIKPKEINNPDESNNINNEFSNFLDEKIPEIQLEIPEAKDGRPRLEDGKKKIERKTVYYGSLVQSLFNNDISELEKLCSILVTCENPLFNLLETMNSKLNLEEYDSKDLNPIQKFLPGISDDQLKAVIYVSRLTYFRIMNKLMKSSKSAGTLPMSFPIETSYYIPKNISLVKEYNKNIATDILLLISYVKEVQRTLLHVEGNISKNKTLLYSHLRLFFDPLMISFITTLDSNAIMNDLKGRYNEYKKNGFFNAFEEYILKYNCNIPSETEVLSFAEKVLVKLSGDLTESLIKINDASKKEKFMLDGFTINKFNFEQITKEITRLETGAVGDRSELSEEVSNLFGYSINSDEENTLERFVREHINEVPFDMRKDFIIELNNCKNDRYNFDKNKDKFDIDKLGDNIIIALNVWNPKEADIECVDYDEFIKMFEVFKETYNTPESIDHLRNTMKSIPEDNNEEQNDGLYESLTEGLFD